MKAYLIQSVHEPGRKENVNRLLSQLPDINLVEAVYPSREKVPFLNKMIAASKHRTGEALRPAEIGCLMSHRRIWHDIVCKNTGSDEHFLVMESDSVVNNWSILRSEWERIQSSFDLFFWGAWDGHMQLFRSTRKKLADGFVFGEPFIKTVYCTYGYSVNAKAAKYLLQQTAHIHYPVDQFKRFVAPGVLQIGGVMPELISTSGTDSYIREQPVRSWRTRLFVAILDVKNKMICALR